MISPASFNYYQECYARAEELAAVATQSITPKIIKDDLLYRIKILLAEVPIGILEID